MTATVKRDCTSAFLKTENCYPLPCYRVLSVEKVPFGFSVFFSQEELLLPCSVQTLNYRVQYTLRVQCSVCNSLIKSHGSGLLKFKIWFELVFLARAIALASLAWNELGSNKVELIRFLDSSNPQFYCITSVTMIDATYLNMFSRLRS